MTGTGVGASRASAVQALDAIPLGKSHPDPRPGQLSYSSGTPEVVGMSVSDEDVLDSRRIQPELADVVDDEVRRVRIRRVYENEAVTGGDQVGCDRFEANVKDVVDDLERVDLLGGMMSTQSAWRY